VGRDAEATGVIPRDKDVTLEPLHGSRARVRNGHSRGNYQILVPILPQNVHGLWMDKESAARAINLSLWGLALLISGGTILAYFLR
jgi:hypothetical protein